MEEQVETQPTTKTIQVCPVCQSTDLRQVLEIPQIPVLANVLWTSREEALAAARGNVDLVYCNVCGHIYNQAFNPAEMEYDVQYENSLHFSPRFQEYATWLTHYLVNRHDLHGKAIIEIGSGKGDFLRQLCEYGGNVGTGFDPSYQPAPGDSHPAMSFVRDIYTERYSDHQADLILARHVLEHIFQPSAFIQSLRRTIGANKRTIVYIEVPNLGYILRDTAIWDLIYEHYSYFSSHSLAELFTRNGFNILNLSEAFESQFLFAEAIPRDPSRPAPNSPSDLKMETLSKQVASFAQRSANKLAYWQEQIDQLRSSGKRAVIWGAGSKGISFLNMLHIRDEIEYIIDINPRKRNMYVTGAGQQIVPPEILVDYRPDTVIVMNPIYRQEIEKTVDQLGLKVEFLFAS